MPKYLLFLTGIGGWSGKGQKHPCNINVTSKITQVELNDFLVIFIHSSVSGKLVEVKIVPHDITKDKETTSNSKYLCKL